MFLDIRMIHLALEEWIKDLWIWFVQDTSVNTNLAHKYSIWGEMQK